MYRTRDHIDEYLEKCIKCGKCRKVCPSYRHGGCDPMAVMSGDLEKVFDCVGCGECTRICPTTDPKRVMLCAYSIVTGMELSEAFKETGLARPLRDEPSRTELVPEWTGDDAYVMPGCIVKCLNPHLEYTAAVALNGIGVSCSELKDFTCCMYPIQFEVMDDFERISYMTRMGESAMGKDLVTMCAGCSEIMQKNEVDCIYMIPFLHRYLDRLPKFDNGPKVSMEPGCSAKSYADMMREILEHMGCKIVGDSIGCCGKASRKVAEPLMKERQEDAKDADIIVVGCPMCFEKYDSFPNGKPVVYITELVSMAMGDTRALKYHRTPVPSEW